MIDSGARHAAPPFPFGSGIPALALAPRQNGARREAAGNDHAAPLDGPYREAGTLSVSSLGRAEADEKDIVAVRGRGSMRKPDGRPGPDRRFPFERGAGKQHSLENVVERSFRAWLASQVGSSGTGAGEQVSHRRRFDEASRRAMEDRRRGSAIVNVCSAAE